MGETYLVGGHREGVNVTLFRGIAVREVKLRWIQQFRSHVTNNPRLGRCCATRLHDGGIGDDTHDSEVPKARIALFGNKDVPLDRTGVGACLDLRTPSIAHRIDITVHNT